MTTITITSEGPQFNAIVHGPHSPAEVNWAMDQLKLQLLQQNIRAYQPKVDLQIRRMP